MQQLRENKFLDFCRVVRDNSLEDLVSVLWADPNYQPKQHLAAVAERHFNPKATQWAWLQEIKSKIDWYENLYEMLDDTLSKNTLTSIMLYRLTWDGNDLAYTQQSIKYFNWDLVKRPENAVYIDAGAYDGGSVLNFVESYGSDYAHIYAFEPFEASYAKLKESCSHLPRTSLEKKGLWDGQGLLEYAGEGQSVTSLSAAHSNTRPAGSIEVVALDHFLNEKVSFIKMDIEGSELHALRGATNIIKRDTPSLAICAYHLLDDLRTIPSYILGLNKGYRLNLRNYKTRGSAEIVLYAYPN